MEPTSEMTSSTTPYDAKPVLASLRGQNFAIADFNAIFSGWPSKVNPNLEELRQDVTTWLESTLGDSKLLGWLKDADFGLFGATWWPQASIERLRIVTYISIWLFIWETSDEVDKDNECFWNDFERSQKFRAVTLRYVRACLGVSGEEPGEEPSRIVGSFKVIGDAIRKAYNTEQCERLVYEMTILMYGFELEQRIRLSPNIPSVEEFWKCRIISSGVGVCVAVNEFACGDKEHGDMQIPQFVMDSPSMKLLWRSTNTILSTLNEIMSLKKALGHDSIQTLVPLLFIDHGNLQIAADKATEMIIDGVRDFEEAARQLLSSEDASSEAVKTQILGFVDACKFQCTGHLIWSFSTPRYGLKRYVHL